MCFSPEADATMGIVIGAIAVDAGRHVRERSQLPLAALPGVLALHQLIEVFVWWGLDGTVPHTVGHAAVYAYLIIAYGIPLLVPGAVAAVEPDDARRRLMDALAVVAAIVALVLLWGVATGPVGATDHGDLIAYSARLFQGGALTVVYVVTTVGCLLLSSHRFVVVYGLLNLGAVAGLAWLMVSGFISLWCAWAAITSVIIAVHLRAASRPPVLRPAFGRVAPTDAVHVEGEEGTFGPCRSSGGRRMLRRMTSMIPRPLVVLLGLGASGAVLGASALGVFTPLVALGAMVAACSIAVINYRQAGRGVVAEVLPRLAGDVAGPVIIDAPRASEAAGRPISQTDAA